MRALLSVLQTALCEVPVCLVEAGSLARASPRQSHRTGTIAMHAKFISNLQAHHALPVPWDGAAAPKSTKVKPLSTEGVTYNAMVLINC